MNRFMTNIMMPLLNKMTEPCNVVSHHISESMDHRLPFKHQVKMKVHILFCKFCRRYYKQLYQLREKIQQTCDAGNQEAVISLPSDFKDELKQKLRQARDGK